MRKMSIQEKEELIAELTEHINQVHECMLFHNPLSKIPLDIILDTVEEYHSMTGSPNSNAEIDYAIIKQIRNINGDNYDKTNLT